MGGVWFSGLGGLGRAPKALDVERRKRENRGAEGAEGGGVQCQNGVFWCILEVF